MPAAHSLPSNGNPVPKAGIFHNGSDVDKGPSDLALDHTLLIYGLVQLPWKIDVSDIFRAQSGFHYSASFATNPPDVDGGNNFNGLDFTRGRNHFIAAPFTNMDIRVAKRFDFAERAKLCVYLEFFNLFNRDNPAAVNGLPPGTNPSSNAPKFGQVLQVLPGREGQVAIRLEFSKAFQASTRSGFLGDASLGAPLGSVNARAKNRCQSVKERPRDRRSNTAVAHRYQFTRHP
jgi:hypothetical protein